MSEAGYSTVEGAGSSFCAYSSVLFASGLCDDGVAGVWASYDSYAVVAKGEYGVSGSSGA